MCPADAAAEVRCGPPHPPSLGAAAAVGARGIQETRGHNDGRRQGIGEESCEGIGRGEGREGLERLEVQQGEAAEKRRNELGQPEKRKMAAVVSTCKRGGQRTAGARLQRRGEERVGDVTTASPGLKRKTGGENELRPHAAGDDSAEAAFRQLICGEDEEVATVHIPVPFDWIGEARSGNCDVRQRRRRPPDCTREKGVGGSLRAVLQESV